MSCLLGLETFHWQTIPGFIILVIGTLLYNEIFEVPCFGFNQNTKRAIAERELALSPKTAGKGKDIDYVGTSPQALYDQTRKQRALNAKKDGMRGGRRDGDDNEDYEYDLDATDEQSGAKINYSNSNVVDYN